MEKRKQEQNELQVDGSQLCLRQNEGHDSNKKYIRSRKRGRGNTKKRINEYGFVKGAESKCGKRKKKQKDRIQLKNRIKPYSCGESTERKTKTRII